MVVASLAATRRTKFMTSRISGGFADDFALLRGRLFGDVLDGGDHAGELAVVVEHLVGAHHHQALHAVVGVQPDGACWARKRAWSRPTSTPHPGSQTEQLKISWQCFPKHLLRRTCRRVFRRSG